MTARPRLHVALAMASAVVGMAVFAVQLSDILGWAHPRPAVYQIIGLACVYVSGAALGFIAASALWLRGPD